MTKETLLEKIRTSLSSKLMIPLTAATFALSSCGGTTNECSSSLDCNESEMCIDGNCEYTENIDSCEFIKSENHSGSPLLLMNYSDYNGKCCTISNEGKYACIENITFSQKFDSDHGIHYDNGYLWMIHHTDLRKVSLEGELIEEHDIFQQCRGELTKDSENNFWNNDGTNSIRRIDNNYSRTNFHVDLEFEEKNYRDAGVGITNYNNKLVIMIEDNDNDNKYFAKMVPIEPVYEGGYGDMYIDEIIGQSGIEDEINPDTIHWDGQKMWISGDCYNDCEHYETDNNIFILNNNFEIIDYFEPPRETKGITSDNNNNLWIKTELSGYYVFHMKYDD